MRARADWEAVDPDEEVSLQRGRLYWQTSDVDLQGWVRGYSVDDPDHEGFFPKVGTPPRGRLLLLALLY